MAKKLAKAQYGASTKRPLSEAEKRKMLDDLYKKVGDPRPTKPASPSTPTPPPPAKVPVSKPKSAKGGTIKKKK